MKKIFFLLMFPLLLGASSTAQTIFWSDDFNSNLGWTLEDNWSIANGKLRLYWNPAITNFDLSATSSSITLPENTMELIVKQYLDIFSVGNPPETAEIILVASGNNNVLWSHTFDNGNWGNPAGSELVLDVSEFAGQEVQIMFRSYGPTTYNWNWWDIFSVGFTQMLNCDLTALEVSGPTVLDISETGQWEVQVKNLGDQSQTDFTVQLFSNKFNELLGTLNVTDDLAPGEEKNYEFEWTPDLAQNTTLYGKVVKEGDEFEQNDISTTHFVRVSPDIDFSILVWDDDNGIETIIDPEAGDEIQASTALTRALDATGLDYIFVTSLPQNLTQYDMIFCTMGCYCLS